MVQARCPAQNHPRLSVESKLYSLTAFRSFLRDGLMMDNRLTHNTRILPAFLLIAAIGISAVAVGAPEDNPLPNGHWCKYAVKPAKPAGVAGQFAALLPVNEQQRRQDFQDRAVALQRQVESVRRTLDGASDATLTQIRLVALEEIGALAEERGVDIVLSEAQVIVARNVFDLTEETLARLDARLPSVDIAVTESDN